MANVRTLIFRQMFEHVSSTYTYLLACTATKEAVIIDPVLDTVDRDVSIIKEMHLKLKYAINTHVHADHITGSGMIKRRFTDVKSVISGKCGGKADHFVKHHDKLTFGNNELEVRETPGHTNGCLTYVLHNARMAFTGDALLIRGCGRTDFQEGSAARLYDSVHEQILSLPKDYLLYPAHDYKGLTATSVAEELLYNLRLTKSKEEFIKIMDNLKLAYPKQIDKAVPANLVCGIIEQPEFKPDK